MIGINLDKPMEYVYASFRYFEEGEKHTTRICKDDVLLLVFDGILAFTEDGVDVSVGAGEYYIQKKAAIKPPSKKANRRNIFTFTSEPNGARESVIYRAAADSISKLLCRL